MAAQGGREVVVQQVVRDVGGAYPMLTQYNYVEWVVADGGDAPSMRLLGCYGDERCG